MQAQERNMNAQFQNQSIWAMQGLTSGVTRDESGNIDQTSYQNYITAQQEAQSQIAMAKSMWQNMFEMQREAQLQPLKDLEDSLQTEKDNLESRLKIAQAEYDAKKEEEKAGVKGLTPDTQVKVINNKGSPKGAFIL